MPHLLKLLILSAALAAPTAAHANENGALTVISVKDLFIPVGFDDNDQVTVVVDGYLPDSCYKLAHIDVHYLPDQHKYVVFQFARKYHGVCLDALVPFTTEVQLGTLPMGDFAVEVGGAAAADLAISEATSAGPDDHLYAAVEKARVEVIDGGVAYAIIDGRMTNSCMQFGEVKVINSGKTIEVLPIMKMISGPDCIAQEVPFSWRAPLPANTTNARRLLHVRSLNGKSVNVVF